MKTPEQPYRLWRAVVGTGIIAVVVALWAWSLWTGQPLGTLWDVVMLVLLVASGYAVFGAATMQAAIEDAQDLQGEDDTPADAIEDAHDRAGDD